MAALLLLADLLPLALQVNDHVTTLRWLPIASLIVPVILLIAIWAIGSRRTV